MARPGYWHALGGRHGAAIVRVALAVAVLLTLRRLLTLTTVHFSPNPELYHPVGIWQLLGSWVPPPAVFTGLQALAWLSTITMALGLFSRTSGALSAFAAIALTSISFAERAHWSHQYNVVMLAHLAFLGARSGDVWSLDAWWRAKRGLPAHDVPGGYQWSLRLVQFAVAYMFVNACLCKLAMGKFTLRWALSDNLRHHLLMRYDLAGLDRPALVDWLVAEPWRYQTVALLNLISQAMPLLAVIFVRRPLVRLWSGAFFVLEVIALGPVVELWNLHWLPLVAVFVDWDWLLGKWGRNPHVAVTPPRAQAPRLPLAVWTWIVCFVLANLVIGLVPKLDQKLGAYPFSAFPMFAKIRAQKPYSAHLPYATAGDAFEVISTTPLDRRGQRWMDLHYRNLFEVRDPAKVEAKLRAVLATMQAKYPQHGITGIRHWYAIFETQAHPGPAKFERYPIALTGEITSDGVFHSALGRLTATTVRAVPRQIAVTTPQLTVYRDDQRVPTPLAAPVADFEFALGRAAAANALYVITDDDGRKWVIASRRVWKWN